MASLLLYVAPGEAWVLFLEKAFAQLLGNYRDLNNGYPHVALHCLTGRPMNYCAEASLSCLINLLMGDVCFCN